MPAKVKRVDWRCPVCSKRLWLRPPEAERRKACSRACGYQAMKTTIADRYEEWRKEHKGGWKQAKGDLSPRACPVCGVEFTPRYGTQVYCSQPCGTINAQNKRRKGSVEPRNCEVCGSEFTPRKQSTAGRFCSKECQYKSRGAAWKGGRIIRSDGYVDFWVGKDYPGAQSHGYITEHRYVMQEHLGRPLLRTESVHHINGQRDDNRLENLQLRNSQWHGPGQALQCLDCGSQNIAHVPVNQNMVGI